MTLLKWLTFLLASLIVTLTVLGLFISSDASTCPTMAFPPLGNSVMLLSQFRLTLQSMHQY